MMTSHCSPCVQGVWGSSVHQVLELRVDERKHDSAGSVQDSPALEQSPGFGAPRLGLKVEVDGVQSHSEEVSN